MDQPRAPGKGIHLAFRILAVGAVVAAFAQVTLGGVVRVTGSGLGCPDWPLCYGRVLPPLEFAALVEYSHRLSASGLTILVLATVALAWLFYRRNYWILISSVLGLALVFTAAVLGGLTVLTELAWWLVLLHLGIAELVVACMVVVMVVGWPAARRPWANDQGFGETHRFNLLVLASVIGTFALMLSGSYMVGYGAGSSCAAWPLCGDVLLPKGAPDAIHMGHRFLAAVVGVLIVATAVSAWSRRGERPELGWAGLLLAVLFGAQVIVGAGTVFAGFSSQMKAFHLSMATLVWVGMVYLAALMYPPQRFAFSRLESSPGRLSELEGLTP